MIPESAFATWSRVKRKVGR